MHAPAEPSASASIQLQQIHTAITECQRCQLAQSRINTVPGEGPFDAEVLFIGEGPGRDEDQSGRPFVGRAGKFLDELIASIPMRREDVFIANVIKCRPPDNRDPEKKEIDACSSYIKRQIALIDPLVIVTLGRFALNWFFPGRKITQSHGAVLRYENRVVLPLYHPASGLRNPPHAERLRQDIHVVPDAMGQAIRNRMELAVSVAQSSEDDESIAEESVALSVSESRSDPIAPRHSEAMVATPLSPVRSSPESSAPQSEADTGHKRQESLF